MEINSQYNKMIDVNVLQSTDNMEKLTEQSLELSIEDDDEEFENQSQSVINPLQQESGFTNKDEMVMIQTPSKDVQRNL